MAKTSSVARSAKKPKFSTRAVKRCMACGRSRFIIGKVNLCRICFREMANDGLLPGIRKSSW